MRFKLFFRRYTSLMLTIVGVAAACFLSMLFVNIQLSNSNRIEFNNRLVDNQNKLLASIKQTAIELKSDSHADHDAQLEVLNCIVELFGSRPNTVILRSESDACLLGTRIAPSKPSGTAPPSDGRVAGGSSLAKTPLSNTAPLSPAASHQPTAPTTPPNAIERLGYILNDTIGEIPTVVKNVFNLITP